MSDPIVQSALRSTTHARLKRCKRVSGFGIRAFGLQGDALKKHLGQHERVDVLRARATTSSRPQDIVQIDMRLPFTRGVQAVFVDISRLPAL
jgi:hypothetical protein